MNWVHNIRHAVHPSKHKCILMHAFNLNLFSSDYTVGLQLTKSLMSTLLTCNLELKARFRTHFEISVISTVPSLLSMSDNRQTAASADSKQIMIFCQESPKEQPELPQQAAFKRTAQCQLTRFPSQVILLMWCHEAHYRTHMTKEKQCY